MVTPLEAEGLNFPLHGLHCPYSTELSSTIFVSARSIGAGHKLRMILRAPKDLSRLSWVGKYPRESPTKVP